jgi:hypothetical protein
MQPLEDKFREFEAKRGWRLSLPAKVVIHQGLISLYTDALGMGEITSQEARSHAFQKALDTLPNFLIDLTHKAEKHQASKDKEIGAIFVLQHVKVWAQMFGCSCWPT